MAPVLGDRISQAAALLVRPGPPQQLRVELALEARQAVHRRPPRAQLLGDALPLRARSASELGLLPRLLTCIEPTKATTVVTSSTLIKVCAC